MSYQLKVIKDYPIGFWPLDESSGSTAADISGCGNNGTYVGSPAANMLPLVPGGISGTKITNTAYATFPITKDYYGANVGAGFGTKYTSDNDFTLEVWVSQNITTTSETPLLADITNDIGLYWEKGDIVFKVSENDSVRYCMPYTKKSLHLTGVYSVNSITLFIDSVPVASKELNSFKFTNTTLTLQSGPTLNSSDSFIVDAPAVYRYGLNQDALRRHYIDGNVTVSPIHVVYPDNGILFTGTDANIRAPFDYSYPVNKPWTQFLDENIYYDSNRKYITFYETDTVQAKTFIIEDFFLIPLEIGLTTSKVEWRNDFGITVESSVNGTTWVACTNGQPLPQYTKDSFDSSGKVYVKITMSTTDASKFLPKLSFFCVTFYSDRTIFADNFGDKITSTTDYYLGSLNYPILSRNAMNGIKCKADSGFVLSTQMDIQTLEFFYTPDSYNDSGLVSSTSTNGYTASNFSWRNSGTISKSNISKIYVNNVDKTSETNVSNVFVLGQPHHVVIEYASPISGDLTFNYSLYGGIQGQFKNIAIYEKAFTAQEVETHFELYTGKPVETLTESAITLTELSPSYYNNDWIVLQSV
jgi:hypothetical protein